MLAHFFLSKNRHRRFFIFLFQIMPMMMLFHVILLLCLEVSLYISCTLTSFSGRFLFSLSHGFVQTFEGIFIILPSGFGFVFLFNLHPTSSIFMYSSNPNLASSNLILFIMYSFLFYLELDHLIQLCNYSSLVFDGLFPKSFKMYLSVKQI